MIGRYRARLASSENDIITAQALLYRCFNLFNKVRLDADCFDTICKHVLIENSQTEKLICCYRILSFADGQTITQSYSSQFYNLDVIKTYSKPMIEVGRFCIDPDVNDPEIVLAAWASLTQIVDKNHIELLFGCSSFEGINEEKYHHCFALLGEQYIAPEHLRPKIKSSEVICYHKDSNQKVDKRKAFLNMPPLLKTYLSMGAWVSDHAVIDSNMNTLHLFTGMEISKIPENRKQFLRNLV